MNLFLLLLHGIILFSVARYIILASPDVSLRKHAGISLVLKLTAGIALGLVYQYYYLAGDTFTFHEEALVLTEYAAKQPWEYIRYVMGLGELPVISEYAEMPRVLFISKWLSVIHLATGGSYWISSLYFSFFSWWGMWVATSRIAQNYPKSRAAALLAGLYIPSFIFWSSGITKESVAIGAFGFIVAFFVSPFRRRVLSYLVVLLMIWWLWNVKYFYVVPLLFSILLFKFWDKLRWGWGLKLLVLPVIGLVVFAGVAFLNPNFIFDYFPEMIWINHEAFVEKSDPGSYIVFPVSCPEWSCVIINFPWAVISALFRPGVWEVQTIFQWIVAIQNFVFTIFMFDYFRGIRRFSSYPVSMQHRIVAAWVFVISLAGFMGLAAPNFGTLQRYCVIIIPVWVFLLTCDSVLFNRLARRIS